MVQIAALVLGFPVGYFVRNKRVALIALTVVLGLLLVPQTISVRDDGHLDPSYWVVQVITFAVAYGLVTWGAHIARRRRAGADATAGVPLR
jgi:hypothetical protein